VKDLMALRELYTILTRLKKKNLADVVHLHSSKSGFLGRVACKLARIDNVVYTPNGASFLGKNYVITGFYKKLEKIGNLLGGRVVCCSESELAAYQKIGINATYINNGVAISTQVPKSLERKNGKFRIVTSGRIVSQKNPGLFNSIAMYFEGLDLFEFIWIGDGDDKNLLTSSNITITGWKHETEASQLIESCDVYLSTSQYEGLSFAVLRALSHGKAVLLSNCVGNTDVVKPGINGDLFNNKAEAISKILKYNNNADMLTVMGDSSRKICEQKFDMNYNLKGYRILYIHGIPDFEYKSQLVIA
ncbi:MAG: glycosyltransferase, partial [Bacteroidota bacterium]